MFFKTKTANAFRATRAVAQATVLEGLQRPVVLLLTLTCLVMSALQPLIQLHSFGEPGRLTRDGAMAFTLVFGLLIAAFCSGEGFSRELRDGTAAACLAGPVSRFSFLTGKFFGTLAVVAVFSWCAFWTALLASRTAEAPVETALFAGNVRDVRCGFLSLASPAVALLAGAVADMRRRRFGLWFFIVLSVILPLCALMLGFWGRTGEFSGFLNWNPHLDLRLITPFFLISALLGILAAWTTAFSTRLSTGPSLALAFLCLGLGFFVRSASDFGAIGKIFFAFLPDVQAFWVADQLRNGASVPFQCVVAATSLAVLQAAGAMCIASALFRNKDL